MRAVNDHLDNIVRPALRNYIDAERALDRTNHCKDAAAIDAARGEVVRTARTAATELHHLADVVLVDTAPRFADLGAIRQALRAVCVFDRGTVPGPDTDLLHDAADAFKHFVLSRPSATITGAAAIVSIGNGWGEMRYGEQKYGGQEQVTITRNDGNKYALLWIVQNSYDAWIKVLGLPQTPLWQY
ncbi:MAG: hypothetical protein JOY90_36345 [Bradyrhizobium sp.]|uniref:hypothetical protein n=1 Tax=Bradyrhizobium sp. TaxID=376 RepID=UPI001DC83C02|nr:hypothetical protein [Bradyrhizobium sp.]MBV9565883.1 hypothetical protein [Bradyrhizobium sp.]